MDKRFTQMEVLDDTMIALMRNKTPMELTLHMSRLFSQTRDRLKVYLQYLHPEWTDAQIREELLRRIHGTN